MTDPEPSIIDIFREEGARRLDRMVQTLVALRTGCSSGAIEGLFRDAHSIKGAAAMIGIDEARSIAWAVEDVLADARERDELDRELIDPLLLASAALRRAVAGETGVAATVLEELAQRRAQREDPGARARSSALAGGPDGTPHVPLGRTR